jgi:hypothetical protein
MAARDLNHTAWRKSSYSGGNNCVEIGWHKSSYSAASGNCVEIGWTESTAVAVRDSKQPAGATLSFSAATWHTFLASKNTLG